jgi:hypothetical protein
MDARKVAAQFAAYLWYEEVRSGKPSPQEALRFASQNWRTFLPVAPEGMGRLLTDIAKQPHGSRRKTKPRRRLALA